MLHTQTGLRELRMLYDTVCDLESISTKSIDSFVNRDRPLAIEAIAAHRKYQDALAQLRIAGKEDRLSVDFLDLIHMFGRIGRSWEDVADLVQPVYAKP